MANDTTAFGIPSKPLERPEVLAGFTYKITVPNTTGEVHNIYITINELDRRPFEVFVDCRDAVLYEQLTMATVLISRLLRLGVPLVEIAEDLQQIASATTAHFADREWCPSLASRIGRTLASHESRRQALLDLAQ